MTTKHSPLSKLKAQADKIAATLKSAERGDKIEAPFADKIAASRNQESFKVGIVMDDKVITIEMPWTTIRDTSEVGLAHDTAASKITLLQEALYLVVLAADVHKAPPLLGDVIAVASQALAETGFRPERKIAPPGRRCRWQTMHAYPVSTHRQRKPLDVDG